MRLYIQEEEVKPKVLDQQRCTVIEIIMKRMSYPVAILKEAVMKADFSILTLDNLSELTSLFPAKSYDAERQMLMENYKVRTQSSSQIHRRS